MPIETWPSPEIILPKRSLGRAVRRGLRCRCPNCGGGQLFGGFLKPVNRCEACGADFSPQRADDLPAYLTIFIVGHLVIPLVLWIERAWHPEIWIQMIIWLPLTLVMMLLLLQPIKGAVIALQWANYMHGFNPLPDSDQDQTYRRVEDE